MAGTRQAFKAIMAVFLFVLYLAEFVYASANTPVRRQEPEPTAAEVTAVSGCHLHETSVFCMVEATEYLVRTAATATTELPAAFTDCHSHGSDMFCVTPEGDDVEIVLASEAGDTNEDDEEHEDEGDSSSEVHCHFHAGVEHCVGGSDSEASSEGSSNCEPISRDYNIPLRIGLLFVILATSAIGVFGPILLATFLPPKLQIVFVILKQFGTGVIISTAFVHLLTHAGLMFSNPCLGDLSYEATAAAILMAGIFLSFLVEYLGQRLTRWQSGKKRATEGAAASAPSMQMVNIAVLEAGILFHSLLIGLTLVVAGDSFFLTLFAVILFHQMFEGIALGTRIAALGTPGAKHLASGHGHGHGRAYERDTSCDSEEIQPVPMYKKLLLASGFAIVTPVGMAIGIGVLHKFNGNDPSTIIAIGTLDAFSAGILVWVGVVEMWAEDWMLGGEMTRSGPITTGVGFVFLVAGMVLMSLLGKWA